MRQAVAFLLIVGPCSAGVRADGGIVRVSEVRGPYRVTVFTAPTPLCAGPIDVSVLVQDAATGALAADCEVAITASLPGRPETAISHPATPEAATNKLFRAAHFDLPHPEKWQISAMVNGPRGKTEVQFEAEVREPQPAGSELLWWIVWPIIPVGLFVVHQFLARGRKQKKPRLQPSEGAALD